MRNAQTAYKRYLNDIADFFNQVNGKHKEAENEEQKKLGVHFRGGSIRTL